MFIQVVTRRSKEKRGKGGKRRRLRVRHVRRVRIEYKVRHFNSSDTISVEEGKMQVGEICNN